MNSRLRLGLGLFSLLFACGAAGSLSAQCCETPATASFVKPCTKSGRSPVTDNECETVYEAQEVTRQVPVWETQTARAALQGAAARARNVDARRALLRAAAGV